MKSLHEPSRIINSRWGAQATLLCKFCKQGVRASYEQGNLSGPLAVAPKVQADPESRGVCVKCAEKFGEGTDPIPVRVISFGFKYGWPEGQSKILTFDLRRSVRNPHNDPALRELTGLDPEVRAFVERCLGCKAVQDAVAEFSPLVAVANDAQLAFGCHGGKHRSVVLAQIIGERLNKIGKWWKRPLKVTVEHRDILKA